MSTSDGRTLPSEECGRCNGTGEIMREVGGRTGYVNCPNCENVPQYAVPDEVPDDPEGRIEEINDRLAELRERKERANDLLAEINETKSTLSDVAGDGILDDDVSQRFGFIAEQIGIASQNISVRCGISYQREALKRERAEIQTLLDHLQSAADGEEST